ncbi:uncharacterized protein LOC127250646 isoform X2 [Andrographis paniculata]|nr:uncharacterized protein LOC127250646 isoform X2 [Andrographis paniculata]
MHISSLANEAFNNVNSELKELPSVELSTLPLILKIVESGTTDQLRVTELILHDQDLLRKLMELFRICEDLDNLDGLHLLFKIVRGMILLNNSQIIEKLFGDDLIMDIIGCLEYDPEVPHTNHRNFLKEHVVFKEAIPIKDSEVLSRIHQSYRVSYLKDVMLPRALDEGLVATFNSIIHSNNAIVVSLLKDDKTFIKELFARLHSPYTSVESKKTLVHFVHEFCTLSKSLQMVHQVRLFRDLVNEGIFDIIADVLQSEDYKLVLTGADILMLFQNLDANILRSHVSRQDGVLFGLLVKSMLTDCGDDMHCQFLEIIRSLLESTPGTPREVIVEIFYEQHLDQLIDAIASSCPPNTHGESDKKSLSSVGNSRSSVKPEILLNICELLCFCVLQHPYRIKCNFLLNNVIEKVLYLMRRREKYLLLGAIRFVRVLISRSDEHLMNYIAKNNLLKPIIDAFVANGNRYNLLSSAILELFEFIRKENLKILLRYLVDTFWDQLAKFETMSSIHALKLKYEQSLENTDTRSTGTSLNQRKRLDDRALEKEEEDYFNDSDEEDSASVLTSGTKKAETKPSVLANGSLPNDTAPRSDRLVDYDDDDDDEDYKPPPKRVPDASDEEELAQLPLKRKLVSKEPEAKRLRRSPKDLKSRGVFATLCSTLSDAVLPNKKVGSGAVSISGSNVNQNSDKGHTNSSLSDQSQIAEIDGHKDEREGSPRSLSDELIDSADNRKHGDEPPLLPPNSPAEMAVNGS